MPTPPFLHPQSDEPALIEAGGGAWTHAELAGTVRERARAMAGRRSLVFVRCGVDARTVIDYLAALTAGHAVALVDGELPGERLSELVERYRPALVLGPDGAAEHKTDVDPHENLSLLLSTSASTGSPRLVRLAGSALEANAVSIALYLELGGDDRAIASLPFHYSYGLSILNSHLLAGGSIVLPREGVVQAGFWSTFERYACTSFAGVPYTYELLRRAGWDRLPLRTLRTMTQAGGRLSDERSLQLHNEMEFRGGRFIVMYGQTEATARMAWLPPSWLEDKLGSVGVPIPGGRLEADDGELVYRGANVMMGYASEREHLARGDELGGVLRTGDLGHSDDDGFFWVTGRSKRFVKVHGLRINLDEVERAVPVPSAAVGADDRAITVFAVGADPDGLRAALAERFRMRSRTFDVRAVEGLPTTASGKVDYAALRQS